MKQTTFFLFLFALCFIACTKVQQINPSAEGTRYAAAKSQNPNGGGNPNPFSCTLPAPTGLVVTSPYASASSSLQKLNLKWNTLMATISYQVKVVEVSTGVIVYNATVPPSGVATVQHLTTNVFLPFVQYEVRVAGICPGTGGAGSPILDQIIITGGPASGMQQDLERPTLGSTILFKAMPEFGITKLGCDQATAPLLASGPLAFSFCASPRMFLNLTTQIMQGYPGTIKVMLNIPVAVKDDYLAISEYPTYNNTAPCTSYSAVKCSSQICCNSSTNNPTWVISKFHTDDNIAVPITIDPNKRYRFRLLDKSSTFINAYPNLNTAPSGGYNNVVIECTNN